MTGINGTAGRFENQVCLTPKPGLFPLCFHSFLAGGHCELIQQISAVHHLSSSPVLGVVRDTAGNQTDMAPALMEPSQVHWQEALT